MSRPFAVFGPAHLAAIALTFAIPLALGAVVRASGSRRLARFVCGVFAAALIATWMLWYWLIFANGWASSETLLPMQLCDWATVAAVVTLVRPNQRSYELAYFWTLAGTLQALITPELHFDFPDLRFIVFFAFHGGAIAAALYLTFGLAMRPRPASIPRVLAWSLAYLFSTLAVNALIHTNFGYLSAKPSTPSLLDFMAPWPYYVVELAALGIAFVLVLYAPFFLVDLLHARARVPVREPERPA